MIYAIGEVSERIGLPISTIRYYHKNGLMPHVDRTAGGQRRFSDDDVEWLRYLERLRATGMPIAEMREFVELIDGGEETLERRRQIMRNRRSEVEAQLAELQTTLGIIAYKCWYYDRALAVGDEQAARAIPPEEMPPEVRSARELCRFSW